MSEETPTIQEALDSMRSQCAKNGITWTVKLEAAFRNAVTPVFMELDMLQEELEEAKS